MNLKRLVYVFALDGENDYMAIVSTAHKFVGINSAHALLHGCTAAGNQSLNDPTLTRIVIDIS